jgi:hypothetical protein
VASRCAKPLVSYRVIVVLISATTTKTGLTVRCELDTGQYPIARGKNETWGAIGLIGLYFRGIDVPKLPHVGGRNGNDTHASSRSENNTKSFNSPYRKKYVGHRWRRFYVWALWIYHPGGFRSFHRQGKSCLSVRDL